MVRRVIARAAGFPQRGALRWYLQFILFRQVSRLGRMITGRGLRVADAARH